MGSLCSKPNGKLDTAVELPSKINLGKIFKKVAKSEKEAQNKAGYFDMKKEDKVWMNSDISYVNVVLKTK